MLCYTSVVANKLRRFYGAGYLHFITTSCYRRLPLLEKPQHRDLLLEVLEGVRRRYQFVVVGYVIMPEHMHLLLSEPERGDPSKVMQAIKQGFARRLLRKPSAADGRPINDPPTKDPRQGGLWDTAFDRGHVWQARFYDFVVYTENKRVEKLRYMRRNPVKRGLVAEPQQWDWSSYRHYADGERGIVLVNEERKAELRVREIA
jgi:putative transposase